jgi:hypothetical protein
MDYGEIVAMIQRSKAVTIDPMIAKHHRVLGVFFCDFSFLQSESNVAD